MVSEVELCKAQSNIVIIKFKLYIINAAAYHMYQYGWKCNLLHGALLL